MKKGKLVTQAKSNLEVFDKRWDRTSELLKDQEGNRWKRRLDSIARLLEGSSTCAAITLIDNIFFIATNKAFPRGENTEDQGYLLIKMVMYYFQSIVNEQDNKDSYQAIFKIICKQAMAGLQIPSHIIKILDDDFIQGIIKSKSDSFQHVRDFIFEQAEYGHYPAGIGDAFVVCSALREDFDKVIKFINENKGKPNGSEPTSRFLQAIKLFNPTNHIICADKLKGVQNTSEMHAEMRLLSSIQHKLEKKEQFSIYVGISKLCCLHCHCMIYGVNQTSGYKNEVEIRGAHNVLHSAHWNPPFGITGHVQLSPAPVKALENQNQHATRSRLTYDPFTEEVLVGFRTAYTLGKQVGTKGVSEHADLSPPSSLGDISDLFDEYAEGISKLILQLQSLGFEDTVQYKNFLIVQQLCKCSEYKNLWITSCVTNEITQGGVLDIAIVKLANNKEIFNNSTLKENEQKLKEIFKNKVYVGENLARYFSPDYSETKKEKDESSEEDLALRANQSGSDINLGDRGQQDSHYYYSIRDFSTILLNIRKNNFTYVKESSTGEEYFELRENKEKTLLVDPYWVNSFDTYLQSTISRITGDTKGQAVDTLNPTKWQWDNMPETILIPVLEGIHWRAIRIKINYEQRSVNILWDDPYGENGFSPQLKEIIKKSLQNRLPQLFKAHFQNDEDYTLKIEELEKKVDQQGRDQNSWDCGPICLSNIYDYVDKSKFNKSNQDFAHGDEECFTVTSYATRDDKTLNTIRAQDIMHYLETTEEGFVKNEGIKSKILQQLNEKSEGKSYCFIDYGKPILEDHGIEKLDKKSVIDTKDYPLDSASHAQMSINIGLEDHEFLLPQTGSGAAILDKFAGVLESNYSSEASIIPLTESVKPESQEGEAKNIDKLVDTKHEQQGGEITVRDINVEQPADIKQRSKRRKL